MHFHKSLVDKYQKAYCEIFFFLKRFSVDDSSWHETILW